MSKSREKDLAKFQATIKQMRKVDPDMDAPQQFWLCNIKYDSMAAKFRSKARKKQVTQQFDLFIAQNIPEAFDVGSNWGPMNGFGIEGIVFEAEKALRTDRRFIQPMEHLPDYAEGKSCFLGRPNPTSKEGAKLLVKIEQLLADVQGPIEVSDFILDDFGLHKAVGSNIIDGQRVLIPPRVIDSPLGLFICTPKERLYEIPGEFVAVCQSVVAFSQDVMALFHRQDKAMTDLPGHQGQDLEAENV